MWVTDPSPGPSGSKAPADTWLLVPAYKNGASCMVVASPASQAAALEAQVGAGPNTREMPAQGGGGSYVSEAAPGGAGRAPTEHPRQ